MARLAHPYAILPAGPDDAAALARVHVTAWRETYDGILPPGYLDRLSVPLQARRWRRRLTDGADAPTCDMKTQRSRKIKSDK